MGYKMEEWQDNVKCFFMGRVIDHCLSSIRSNDGAVFRGVQIDDTAQCPVGQPAEIALLVVV